MRKYYDELDSLRGLASLSVMFGHMVLIFIPTFLTKALFTFGPLKFLATGTEAVLLFFILSGFVLALPFVNNKSIPYGEFVIKRICRIYIPYIFAIVLAFICSRLFYSGALSGLSEFINGLWSEEIQLKDVFNYLLLIFDYTGNLNYVIWSLVHEMRISLLFPLIMMVVLKIDFRKGLLFAVGLSVISMLYAFITGSDYTGSDTEWFISIHYSSLFILGALIAKYRLELTDKFIELSNLWKYLIFGLGIILFLYGRVSFGINMVFPDFLTYSFYGVAIDSWFLSIGGCIIIVTALSSKRFSKILCIPQFKYIGKISYSIYLVHMIVIATMLHLFNDILPVWIILAVSVVLTIILSSLMYKFIERPAINLGRYLVSKMKRKSIGNITIQQKG